MFTLNVRYVIFRLPAWTNEVLKPNGIIEYIAKYTFKMGADAPLLARLKSGFLLRDILERFSQKINSTLEMDRSLWLYSGHDYTIAHMLHSLGLFEVFASFFTSNIHNE